MEVEEKVLLTFKIMLVLFDLLSSFSKLLEDEQISYLEEEASNGCSFGFTHRTKGILTG